MTKPPLYVRSAPGSPASDPGGSRPGARWTTLDSWGCGPGRRDAGEVRLKGGVALVVVAMLGVVAAALPAQQRFRAGVELVHFGVVVTDRSGTPITGLTAEDFEILEEGTPQTIQHFAAGDPELMPPLHLGFLLDMSGSMERDVADVRTAAIRFLGAVNTAVDVTLVDFDTEVRMARFAADDFPRLIERIRMRKPGGWTAFYDALATYLHGTATQTGQKVAVVYTDGADTRSTCTAAKSSTCSRRPTSRCT
jgi:hypothetical protein